MGSIVAGDAGADRLAVIKFGVGRHLPVVHEGAAVDRGNVATFAERGGVEMGRILARDGHH